MKIVPFMKNKRSFKKSRRKISDDEFREKKIRDPRKDKPGRDFSIEEELEEYDPFELPDEPDERDEEEEDDL